MLLTAGAGHVVNQCLKPHFNSMHCDVREADDKSELLPGTKVIMLLGEYSYVSWMAPTGNVLNEIRGSVLSCRGVPTICSYYPQDCADFKAFERTLNPDSKEYSPDDSGRDDDDADGDEKRSGWLTTHYPLQLLVKICYSQIKIAQCLKQSLTCHINLSAFDWTVTQYS